MSIGRRMYFIGLACSGGWHGRKRGGGCALVRARSVRWLLLLSQGDTAKSHGRFENAHRRMRPPALSRRLFQTRVDRDRTGRRRNRPKWYRSAHPKKENEADRPATVTSRRGTQLSSFVRIHSLLGIVPGETVKLSRSPNQGPVHPWLEDHQPEQHEGHQQRRDAECYPYSH